MNLAINYSPAAANLVQTGEINIDYFKTPDWSELVNQARKLRPVTVHFTIDAGNANLDSVNWEAVEELAQTTGTHYINLHIDARQAYFPGLRVDTDDLADIKKVREVMLSDIKSVAELFGAERVILENSWYRGDEGNTLRLCVQPEFISQVVEETGCGLLLDISHAVIASAHIGMDPFDYLSRLPVSKLRELHFAGIHRIKGRWMDHLSILKKNWRWLDWALTQVATGEWSSPWLLAFEYGGVGAGFEWRSLANVIAEQVPQLVQRLEAFGLHQQVYSYFKI